MNKKFNIKKTGFKTPKNYFDGVEDSILHRLKLESELDFSKDSGFVVPSDYFNSVENKILEKVNRSESKVILFTRKRIMYAASTAAAAILAFSILFNAQDHTIEDLDSQLVESYIIDQDLSTYELTTLLNDEDLNDFTISIENTLTDDSLETYLLENIDIETYIER